MAARARRVGQGRAGSSRGDGTSDGASGSPPTTEPTLTMWEAFDASATRKSIAAGGPAVGYGPGIAMTVAEYNSTQRSQTSATTGAKLLTADGNSLAGAVLNTKQRPSRDEKKGMEQAKAEAREAKSDSQAVAAAAMEGSGGQVSGPGRFNQVWAVWAGLHVLWMVQEPHSQVVSVKARADTG